MVTTNSLLVGSDITKTSNKNNGSRKCRHTSLPMSFPFIFKISTHISPLEDTQKNDSPPTVSQDGNFGFFFLLFCIVEVSGVIK